MRKMPTIPYLAVWSMVCVFPAIPAYCRGGPHQLSGSSEISEPGYQAPPAPFWADRGRLTLGFELAYGLENSIPRDISHINMFIAEPQIGVVAWDSPHSRLPIRRFDVISEGMVGGSFRPGGQMFGTSLLLRFGLQPMGNVVPFFDAGSGPVHTTINAKAPELTGSTQFLSQGGVGLQYFFKPGRALVFEYHYFHMSNAGLLEPNPGFNGGMITIGFSWLRSPGRPPAGASSGWMHFPCLWRVF